MSQHGVEIVALLVSAVHAFEGRPQDGPAPDPEPVARQHVAVRAGLGLVGDRYFNHRAHREAAVTVFAAESLDALRLDPPPDPHAVRRNIVLRGFPVDDLVDRVFSLDSGDGPVRFQGRRPASPCAWMDVAVAPGAFRGLRGHGGVRCVPLDDGVLRLGPAVLETSPAEDVLTKA
jgi:MOSC domain-containing protein YiiM